MGRRWDESGWKGGKWLKRRKVGGKVGGKVERGMNEWKNKLSMKKS